VNRRDGLLRLETADLDEGDRLVRQIPPVGAESFSLTYIAPAGSGHDPAGREGLALMASELLPCGTATRDRVALARDLDRAGATLTTDCSPEHTEVTLWGPEGQLAVLLPLWAEVLTKPRFDSRELSRLRREFLERQMRERTQPDRCAEKELLRRVYATGHPYRETGLGSAGSIAAIRRGDLQRFHRDQFAAEGGIVVATCREPLAGIERVLDRTLRFDGPRGAQKSPPMKRSRRGGGGPVQIEVAGGSQVELRFGGASIARSDPSYPSVFLANQILGGRSLLSRLFDSLREKRGLVYHTSSHLEAMRWGGYWTAQAGTGPKTVNKVQRLLLRELRRFSERPVGTAELGRIRESVIGSIWLELESTSSAHQLAVEAAYHSLPSNFYETWPGVLRALTPPQVQRGAEVGLDAENAAVVIAGPLAGFSD
jgi:zinc protease